MADPIAFVTESNYLDEAVVNGTEYFYVVRAIDAIQSGPVSNEVDAIPATAEPDVALMHTASLWLNGQSLGDAGIAISAWNPDVGTYVPAQATAAAQPVVGVEGASKYAIYDGADDRLAVSVLGTDIFAHDRVSFYAYIYPSSSDARNTIIEWVQNGTENRVVCHVDYDGSFYFDYGSISGANNRALFATPAEWVKDQWHLVEFHLAPSGVEDDGIFECVIDGTVVYTETFDEHLNPGYTVLLTIGSGGAATLGGRISQWALFPLAHDEVTRDKIRVTLEAAHNGTLV